MPVEHIIFAEQTVSWVAPVTVNKAIPVRSVSLDPGVSYVEERTTGSSRNLKYSWPGPKLPTGSLEMVAWYEYLGYFLKASGLHDIANTQQGGTAAYQHGFLPKHDTLPLGLSMQLKRDSDDADNLIGVLFNSFTIACTAGEPVVITADFIAYDEGPTDGFYDYGDGTNAAPAVIASPSYFASTILPYRFQHGSLNVGATPTFNDTPNTYTKADGAAATIESISITWENNYDARVFLGSRLAGNVVAQDFNVSGSFDLDQSTVDETFRNFYRAGTNNMIWLEFASGVEAATGFDYGMIVVVPNAEYRAGGLPDLMGDNARRMQSVEFVGKEDSNGHALNVQIIDTATTY